jgi:hypothetical protein
MLPGAFWDCAAAWKAVSLMHLLSAAGRMMEETDKALAPKDELLGFLNELLEAERAGARITIRTAAETSTPGLAALMNDVHRDEAHWCAILLKWIAHLGGEPSPRVGEFYEKCLALPDLAERAAFINRGQGWVARKLRQTLPKISNGKMHADLSAMLHSHEDNIARTNAFLKDTG